MLINVRAIIIILFIHIMSDIETISLRAHMYVNLHYTGMLSSQFRYSEGLMSASRKCSLVVNDWASNNLYNNVRFISTDHFRAIIT